MNETDLTYAGKLECFKIQEMTSKNLDVRYTIEGETGKITSTSILLDPKTMDMITFDYQELKKILGDTAEEKYEKLLRSILWELQTYQQKGGSYVIPVEILNDFLTEIEEVLPNE